MNNAYATGARCKYSSGRSVLFSRIAGFRGAAQSQILAERLQAQDVLALRQALHLSLSLLFGCETSSPAAC